MNAVVPDVVPDRVPPRVPAASRPMLRVLRELRVLLPVPSGPPLRTVRRALAVFATPPLLLAACGDDSGAARQQGQPMSRQDSITAGATAAQAAGSASDSVARPAGDRPVVLFLGTSLTAGLGLDPAEAYPQRVAELAAAAGTPIEVVNAGLSGETSAGALRRLDWVLRTPADVVVIETGANDGLRGLSPDATRANLEAIVERVRTLQPAARVVLVQMEAPPNLGAAYTRDFRAMYPAVAGQYDIPLVPFLLEGIAGRPELNQADGIHPSAAGARIAARTVWATLGDVVAGAR